MKKKLMMVAMLCGVLSLGACIDDTESQSVTNVRDSKTEELLSIAAMEKAEASAKIALAQAEAALKAAAAEAELAAAAKAEAEAEQAKLEAELQELRNQQKELENEEARLENLKKQAELEKALANAEVAKKEAEKELARIAAEMERAAIENEKALLDAQLALKQAEDALKQATDDLEDAKTDAERKALEAERQKIQDCAAAYTAAVQSLIDAKTTLNSMNTTLASYKAGLVNLEDAKKAAIVENENLIAQYETQIEGYKKYVNYTEDVDALIELRMELSREITLMQEKRNAAQVAWNDEQVDFEAKNDATQAFIEDEFFQFVARQGQVVATYTDPDGLEQPPLGVQLAYVYANWDNFDRYYRYENESNGSVSRGQYGDSLYIEVGALSTDIRQIELNYNNNKEYYTGVKAEQERTLAWIEAQYNGKPFNWVDSDNDGVDDKKEEIVDAVNACDATVKAKAKYDAATTDADKAAAKAEYEACIQAEQDLLDQMYYPKWNIARYTAILEGYDKCWDFLKNFDANCDALQALVEARNDADLAAYAKKVELWMAYREAEDEYNLVDAEYQAVNALYDGTNADDYYYGNSDVTQGASDIKTMISDLEEEIERLQEENEDMSSIESQETLIAEYEARIAAQEALVAVCEANVAYTKAALDAVMAGEEVPEAPEGGEAEGGEEAAPAA